MDSVLSKDSEERRQDDASFDVVNFDELTNDSSLDGDEEMLKVMFHGTKNGYRFGETIDLRFYSFTDRYQMDESDRVGIAPMKKSPFISQKVGSALSNSTVEIISDDLIDDNQIQAKKLTFVVKKLPDELKDERFFQFCYLNVSAQIVGLSVPFQFISDGESTPPAQEDALPSVMEIEIQKSSNDDIHMERQEDDDFVVVRTHENFLKERVEHLTRSNQLIQNLVRSLQSDLAMKISENRDLVEKQKSLELACSNANTELDNIRKIGTAEAENIRNSYEISVRDQKAIISEKEAQIRKLEETLKERTEVIKALNDQYEKVRNTIPAQQEMQMKIENLNHAIEDLRTEYDCYRHKREAEISDLEAALQKSMNNLKNINFKYEMSQEEAAKKERELNFALKKKEGDCAILTAKLENAKIKALTINSRYLAYKYLVTKMKKEQEEKPTAMETSDNESAPSAPPQEATTIEIISDEVESRLDELEREEKKLEKSKLSPLQQLYNESMAQLYHNKQPQQNNPWKATAPSSTSQQEQTIPKRLVESKVQGPSQPSTSSVPPARRMSKIILPCVFCNKLIHCTQSGQIREMIDHLEYEHNQKMCPVCSTLFDMKQPAFRSYFQHHVNQHLTNTKYPNIGR